MLSSVVDVVFSLRSFLEPLYLAAVGLRLAVVADAAEQEVATVLGHFFGIALLLDLRDGSVGGLVVFQLNDHSGFIDIFRSSSKTWLVICLFGELFRPLQHGRYPSQIVGGYIALCIG